jgi:DNA-binding Lrp family transcriptional regulator
VSGAIYVSLDRCLLDDLDLEILSALSKNAKSSVREISRAVKRASSLVHARIKRLEKCGVVRGYTVLIDYRKLGYDVYALTLLQVDGAHIFEVEEALSKEPNIRAIYDITGEYDVALVSVFRSVDELDSFIKRILRNPHIKRSVTSIVLRVVKDSPHIELKPGS